MKPLARVTLAALLTGVVLALSACQAPARPTAARPVKESAPRAAENTVAIHLSFAGAQPSPELLAQRRVELTEFLRAQGYLTDSTIVVTDHSKARQLLDVQATPDGRFLVRRLYLLSPEELISAARMASATRSTRRYIRSRDSDFDAISLNDLHSRYSRPGDYYLDQQQLDRNSINASTNNNHSNSVPPPAPPTPPAVEPPPPPPPPAPAPTVVVAAATPSDNPPYNQRDPEPPR